jgi:hypothetical protein
MTETSGARALQPSSSAPFVACSPNPATMVGNQYELDPRAMQRFMRGTYGGQGVTASDVKIEVEMVGKPCVGVSLSFLIQRLTRVLAK